MAYLVRSSRRGDRVIRAGSGDGSGGWDGGASLWWLIKEKEEDDGWLGRESALD